MLRATEAATAAENIVLTGTEKDWQDLEDSIASAELAHSWLSTAEGDLDDSLMDVEALENAFRELRTAAKAIGRIRRRIEKRLAARERRGSIVSG